MSGRRWAGNTLLTCVSVVVALLASELAVRVASSLETPLGQGIRAFDPLRVLIAPYGNWGYRPNPRSVYRYVNGTVAHNNAAGYRGPLVDAKKPAGTMRVVLLGGSTSYGWGVSDDDTIDAYMRALFRERFPRRRIEVVNLAFDGYDSHQDVERLRVDGMSLDPDLIIVNNGINDVANASLENLRDPDPRTIIWFSTIERLRDAERQVHPPLWDIAKHYAYLARLPAFVREQWSRRREFDMRRHARPNPQAADIFERNLRRIANLAHQAGVPLLLSTPPSSLRFKYRPTDSSQRGYWIADALTTQGIRDDLDSRMHAVVRAEARAGHRVGHVRPPQLLAEDFQDDCHLTPSGNRKMALRFVEEMDQFVMRVDDVARH